MLRSLGVSASVVLFGLSQAWAQDAAPAPQAPVPAQTKPITPAPAPAKPKPKPVVAKPKPPAPKPAEAEKAHLLEKTKDWTVFIHESAEGRVCFAATTPIDMLPKSVKRSPTIFYLTTWQKDNVHNEISVKQGYKLKPASQPLISINNQNFALLADDDKAFAKDSNEELKLIAAMSFGGMMTVKAVSDKGTPTTDQYSLNGVAEAIKKMQEACP